MPENCIVTMSTVKAAHRELPVQHMFDSKAQKMTTTKEHANN